MPDTPSRPARPAVPIGPDHSIDATGLNSMRIDPDAVDDLQLLAASLEAPASAIAVAKTPIRQISSAASSARATFIPILLTGGLICESLAIAWWITDADSPYRRVSLALPIVLVIAGAVLIGGATINIFLSRQPTE